MRANLGETLTMGIGSGQGNLFVSGDYESITALQNKLFELEELKRKNKRLLAEIQRLEGAASEISPMDYICRSNK